MSYVYLRDIKEEQQTDVFMGKGIEKLKKLAEKKECEVIVGTYFEKAYLDE